MRVLYRFWAWLAGYFALPCPLCGDEFYGFQHKRCGRVPQNDRPGYGWMICPRCTAAGKSAKSETAPP